MWIERILIASSVIALGVILNQVDIQGSSHKFTFTDPETPKTLDVYLHPLMIEYMRHQEYPGSDLVIEQKLEPGSNYNRYIVSYISEGMKNYALLTIPYGDKPPNGWPVIIFNHGHIPPEVYDTTERYIEYTDAFSKNGYILLRPDYRGHGNSEGEPEGAYYSPAYTIDVLNAVASIKKHPDANPSRIGMWGHSMGGHITLRSMVVTSDIKAGVIWGGVVGSYQDMIQNWPAAEKWGPTPKEANILNRPTKESLIELYGGLDENPDFWHAISPNSYLQDISGPLALHHADTDEDVPLHFSESVKAGLESVGKPVELYVYPNDDHNISQHLSIALERSVKFFDSSLKQAQ